MIVRLGYCAPLECSQQAEENAVQHGGGRLTPGSPQHPPVCTGMHLQARGAAQLGQHESQVHGLPAELHAWQAQRARQARHIHRACHSTAAAAAHDGCSKPQVVLLNRCQQ